MKFIIFIISFSVYSSELSVRAKRIFEASNSTYVKYCKGLNADSCYPVAQSLISEKKDSEALKLALYMCSLSEPNNPENNPCEWYKILSNSNSNKRDVKTENELLNFICNTNHNRLACLEALSTTWDGKISSKSLEQKQTKLSQEYCKQGLIKGCIIAANNLINDNKSDQAIPLLKISCDSKDSYSCSLISRLLKIKGRLKESIEFKAKACHIDNSKCE